MQISKLRKFWIITATLIGTLFYSMKTLMAALFSKQSRSKIDAIINKWSKLLLKIVKVSYKVFDLHQLKIVSNQSYIVMSNHSSHYDIPLIIVAIPGSVRMIAKKELFRVPVWGHAMQAGEFISIDRNNRRQVVRDLRAAKQKMQNGIIPWIAPEGTRTRTGKMQAFKKGGFLLALQTKAAIIPVGIRGSFNILPPKTLDFNLNQNIEIHIGAPINTTNYISKDVAKLMAHVESEIRVLAGQDL